VQIKREEFRIPPTFRFPGFERLRERSTKHCTVVRWGEVCHSFHSNAPCTQPHYKDRRLSMPAYVSSARLKCTTDSIWPEENEMQHCSMNFRSESGGGTSNNAATASDNQNRQLSRPACDTCRSCRNNLRMQKWRFGNKPNRLARAKFLAGLIY